VGEKYIINVYYYELYRCQAVIRSITLKTASQFKVVDSTKGEMCMKATGIVRPVDALGRIVIPVELRRNLDIQTNDSLEIFVDGSYIMLKKYEPTCVFCGNADNVKLVKGKYVCADCLEEMKKL